MSPTSFQQPCLNVDANPEIRIAAPHEVTSTAVALPRIMPAPIIPNQVPLMATISAPLPGQYPPPVHPTPVYMGRLLGPGPFPVPPRPPTPIPLQMPAGDPGPFMNEVEKAILNLHQAASYPVCRYYSPASNLDQVDNNDWQRLPLEERLRLQMAEQDPLPRVGPDIGNIEPVQERRIAFEIGFYQIGHKVGNGNYAIVRMARHRLTNVKVRVRMFR